MAKPLDLSLFCSVFCTISSEILFSMAMASKLKRNRDECPFPSASTPTVYLRSVSFCVNAVA